MALTVEQIQKAYIAFFNRPADVTGLNNWQNYTGSEQDLLVTFSKSREYTDLFTGKTTTQSVYTVYQNLFGRNPDPSGLQNWVNNIDAGLITIGELAYQVLTSAGPGDIDTVNAKLEAATAFTDYLKTNAKASNNYEDPVTGAQASTIVKDWFQQIKESGAGKDSALNSVNNYGDQLANISGGTTPPTPGSTIWLTPDGKDPTIKGTSGDNIFVAQAGQLNDKTIIDGAGGHDTLKVTLDSEESIAPTVSGVQDVIVRVQHAGGYTGQDNNIADDATIDADRFTGVNRWENNHSRSDLKIEDVKILDNQITKDITVAFVESDAGHVDYALYFDQSSLRNQTNQSGQLIATLVDYASVAVGRPPLENNVYNQLTILVDGVPHVINFALINNNGTYDDLGTAISDGIAALPGLSGLGLKVTVVHASLPITASSGVVLATAPAYIEISAPGHTLGTGSWGSSGPLPGVNAVAAYQSVDNPISTDLVTSTVELDYVGRGDRGGDLVIGSLSTGATDTSLGVQQFDITVKRDSNLEVISSTNNSLQVVNIANSGTHKYLGAYERDGGAARTGDLRVKGDSQVRTLFDRTFEFRDKTGPFEKPDVQGQQYIDGATESLYSGYGFTDVKTINASTFSGRLDLSAILTADVVQKYLNTIDQAPNLANADNVTFKYDLGSNNDILDVAISAANLVVAGTTTREDFVLEIKGENGDDVLSTAIYGGTPGWGHLADGTSANRTDTLSLADAQDDAAPWYVNSKTNANLSIDGGAGNDVIKTHGSGDWKVTLGSGNDTYYADNTGLNAATWVFNTKDQVSAGATARDFHDLVTGDNDDYIVVNDNRTDAGANNGFSTAAFETAGLYGLKLRVVYKDVSTSANAKPDDNTVDSGSGVYISTERVVPTDNGKKYLVTDLNINQAIKQAINEDPVLSKLLLATDGPSNTLVVQALSDGRHVDVNDLQIEFAIPKIDTLSSTEISAWNAAIGAVGWTADNLKAAHYAAFNQFLGNPYLSTGEDSDSVSGLNNYGINAGADYTQWHTSNKLTLTTLATNANPSYKAAFVTGKTPNPDGANSLATADNTVIVDGVASDHDVVVLSTGALSNDTIKWNGSFNNGTVTVVNFDGTEAAGNPTPAQYSLDFTAVDPAEWAKTGNDNKELTIELPGLSPASFKVNLGATADHATASDVADLVVAAYKLAYGSALPAVNNGGVVTLDANVSAGIGVNGSKPLVSIVGDLIGAVSPALINNDSDTKFVQASSDALGEDSLDLTAYGARWLGVTTLDEKGFVSGSRWDVADDDITGTTEVPGSALPTVLTNPLAVYAWGDLQLKAGDKYITLTRENVAKNGDGSTLTPVNDANWNTIYKIELWTAAGTHADAYLNDTDFKGTSDTQRDTAQLIGYVDLGKEIELGTASVDSIVDNIDYISYPIV